MDREFKITQLRNKEFVKIIGVDGIEYFGGNQKWWTDKQLQSGGCGPVSAANILAYLALSNIKYRRLYEGNIKHITINDFLLHMDNVIEFLPPISLNKSVSSFIRNNTKNIPEITLGIPTLRKYINGLINYGCSKGVQLNCYTLKDKNYKMFIKTALDNNKPIAMLNYYNKNLCKVPFTSPEGLFSFQSMNMHWVTITSMFENNKGQVKLEVSTWGGKGIINLKDIEKSFGYFGLIYFD